MGDVTCGENVIGIRHVFNSDGELFLEDKEHSKKVSETLKDENTQGKCLSNCTCEDKSRWHGNAELDALNECRMAGKLCDVTLCVGDEEFPCHRPANCKIPGYLASVGEVKGGGRRGRDCGRVMKLAEDYYLPELSDHVKRFAFENLPAIFVTCDFAQGSLRDDQNVLRLLKQAMSVARDRCSCLQ
ncbi:protein modification by small protein conjugation [Branchiostoma belcheri]|nr:protein modification by small protein conjugation [Branchiostoma belcheri]